MPSTYFERRWPNSPAFQAIARRWCEDNSRLLLELIWRGYDRLLSQELNVVAFSDTDEAKEESLNFLLSLRIESCMTGDEPFCVVHQPPEQTKRKRGRGRSPQPDIGFALYDHPRTVWPMEAKVLKSDRDVGAYVKEVQDNFVTYRYATFSSEGAMLGYLLKGKPEQAFIILETALAQALPPHPHFPNRSQRMTRHQRSQAPHPDCPGEFVCHHLVFRIPTTTG
jgi:hypothetical protein